MYFPCIISYKGTSTEYYPEGMIEFRGYEMATSSPRIVSLCQNLFSNQDVDFVNGIPKTPAEFIKFLNWRFGNQYFAIYSEQELNDKTVEPAEGYSNKIIAVFDLNLWVYEIIK
jgi:hypothetical protein